ncbi:MAG: hypothetical protein M1838_004205 [Thelocarpon superellum]|nr:MAG: hypothetical protein M1838_004205 [Thelocarpon superellum]
MATADAADEPLLTDLCPICNANVPKYRCPRCALRSCSLACSKRHKLWAQCSGLRDPAAYVKREDLATPAGIDRDFNFLVGVERHLEATEHDVAARGIDLDASEQARSGARRPLQRGEVNMTAALARCGVIMDRAPKGMQRQRENQTHWNRRQKCLSWTVEWIDEAETRTVSSMLETSSMQASHERLIEERQRLAKKRKVDGEPMEPSPALPSSTPHFYLLRPRTPCTVRVLIPLPHTMALSECLRDRRVLEFPTIYVLPSAPDLLPEGFVSESEYLGRPDADDSTMERLTGFASSGQDGFEPKPNAPELTMAANPLGFIDERRVLDVLHQDLDPRALDAG